MSELEAVLFDLYDTLAWSDWPSHAGFLASQMGVGREVVVSAYDRLRHERDAGLLADAEAVLAAVMAQCGLEVDSGRARDLAEMEAAHLADHVHLYADAIPTLREVRAAGMETGIVSNCSAATRPVVDRMGLEDEAGVVVLSCEVGALKPSPEIYRAALEALRIPAGRSIFVDDRRDYLDGAAQLGMQTVQIVRGEAFGEEAPGGDHPRVTDLGQIFALLA